MRARLVALAASIKMIMFEPEQQVAGYSDGLLMKDDTYKVRLSQQPTA